MCANLEYKFIHKLSWVFKTNGALDASFSCAMIQLVALTIDNCRDQNPRGSDCDPMNARVYFKLQIVYCLFPFDQNYSRKHDP